MDMAGRMIWAEDPLLSSTSAGPINTLENIFQYNPLMGTI
jgi:hypothetical protein